MFAQSAHPLLVIGLSLALAMLLSVFPLPLNWGWFRPAFVALVVIYWAIVLPQQFGVGAAWVVGLIQDVVQYSVLGQHALALMAVAYVCHLSYQRIRNYALWQQSAWIFILIGIHQLFWNWVHSLQGSAASPAYFLLPAFVSALVWPIILIMMEWTRLRFRVQ
jgi:rod shape-determining protein MreD